MSEIGPYEEYRSKEGLKSASLKNTEADINNPERKNNFFERFEQRARSETDVYELIEGIMPPDALFNQQANIREIQTSNGTVAIQNIAQMSQIEQRLYREQMKLHKCDAGFHLASRTILIDSNIDNAQAINNLAVGNNSEIAGIMLAHEAVHSHQNPLLTEPDPREVKKIEKKETGIDKIEAQMLARRSRDLSILQETQAYILQYSLTGGTNNPVETANKKALITEIVGLASEKGVTQFEGQSIESIINRINETKSNGVTFSEYSENGYAPVLGYIDSLLINYLPKKDRGNGIYRERFRNAAIQIIRLLDKGMSHRQIADLMREKRIDIHEGREWDESRHCYKFLQDAIDQDSNPDALSDESLIEKFTRQTEVRLLKIRSIAKAESPPLQQSELSAPIYNRVKAVEAGGSKEMGEVGNAIIANVEYDLEWYRRGFIEDYGLPENATWEDISNSIVDSERKRIARISGLPENTSWQELNKNGNNEARLQEAKMTHLPNAETLTWEEIIKYNETNRRSWIAEESGFAGRDKFNATWEDIEKARHGQAREYQANKWRLDKNASWDEITNNARKKQATLWGMPENATWEEVSENWRNLFSYRVSVRAGENISEQDRVKYGPIAENARRKHAEYYGLPENATWQEIIDMQELNNNHTPDDQEDIKQKLKIYNEKMNRGEALDEFELKDLEKIKRQFSADKYDALNLIITRILIANGLRLDEK